MNVMTRLILVLVGMTLLLPMHASSRPQATLLIVDRSPLTLRATYFQPRESVRVTVTMGEKRLSRLLRTGPLGGFTVRFVGVRLNYCALPLVITARGTRSGVVHPRLPAVECAMP